MCCSPSPAGGWQEELTGTQFSHATRYGHLLRALSLLGTLCGLAEAAPAMAEVVTVRMPHAVLRQSKAVM